MSYEITVEQVTSITLAAASATVPISGIASAWKPALDKVWMFLRTNQITNTGLNVFLYEHCERPDQGMKIDFGVQVPDRFPDADEVKCVTTPAGVVAKTIHVGPYSRLSEAHSAIHRWCVENQRRIGGFSWEIYEHRDEDPEKTKTTIVYLLA